MLAMETIETVVIQANWMRVSHDADENLDKMTEAIKKLDAITEYDVEGIYVYPHDASLSVEFNEPAERKDAIFTLVSNIFDMAGMDCHSGVMFAIDVVTGNDN